MEMHDSKIAVGRGIVMRKTRQSKKKKRNLQVYYYNGLITGILSAKCSRSHNSCFWSHSVVVVVVPGVDLCSFVCTASSNEPARKELLVFAAKKLSNWFATRF